MVAVFQRGTGTVGESTDLGKTETQAGVSSTTHVAETPSGPVAFLVFALLKSLVTSLGLMSILGTQSSIVMVLMTLSLF